MLKVKILYIKNEVFMKKYVAFFICLLLTVSFLSFIEAKGEEPVRTSIRWGDDVVVDYDGGSLRLFEADNSTGSLFSAMWIPLMVECVYLCVSIDTGKTWTGGYAWTYASSGPDDIGGVVMGDYFYTVIAWDYGETIQRFSTSTGVFDSTYDTTAIVRVSSGVGNRKSRSCDSISLEELNVLRVSMGLPPIEYKERECMACESKFISEGLHNRLCGRCRPKSGGGFGKLFILCQSSYSLFIPPKPLPK